MLISGTGKQYLEGAENADTFVFLTAAGIGMRDTMTSSVNSPN
jgi:hypothetical protein